MSAYRYRCFELIIESEIQLPELLSTDEPPFVHIRYGKAPNRLTKARYRGFRSQISPQEYLLTMEGIVRLHVKNGAEIIVQALQNSQPAQIRMYLLSAGLGALLHQRKDFVLHGSAVATPWGGVVFSGPSGSGKSTLAAAFMQKDYPLLSDDIVVVSRKNNANPVIFPGYPQIRLFDDSAHSVGVATKQEDKNVPGLDKNQLILPGRFSSHPVPLRAVYALEIGETTRPELSILRGFSKLQALMQNAYGTHALAGFDREVGHFQESILAASQVRVGRICRPKQPFLLAELVGLIEKDIETYCETQKGGS